MPAGPLKRLDSEALSRRARPVSEIDGNMFARAAVQGTSAEDSVAQAEAEMKQIYSS